MEERKQQQENNSSTASDQQLIRSTQHHIVTVAKHAFKSDFPLFPPGYRFCPLDEELILHYLDKKVTNRRLPPNRINDVILKNYNPKDLIEEYKTDGEREWYFFTSRDRKYRNGKRPNRAAGNGFWKATGADRPVNNDGTLVGYKKALVFYEGKPPKGNKTNWVMHEFRVLEEAHNPRIRKDENDMTLDDCVLCKVYEKADKGSKKQQEGSKKKQEVECWPADSDDDSTDPLPQLYDCQFDQSLQHNLPESQEPNYENDCRFDHSLQHNLLENDCLFDQSLQPNLPEPQESIYWNDCRFDQSLQHNLPEPQELSYGITNNFSSSGFNSQNHVGLFEMPVNNNPMISSNQPSLQFMDEQLPALSMPSFNQVMDNQQSSSQPSSTQFWNNLQVPKSTAQDDFLFQFFQDCDTFEHPPPLLSPQPQQPPPLAQQPPPSPLKRRRTCPTF